MRYQIVYCKRGWPLTAWADNVDGARKLAEQLRSTGYSVDVWQHTKDGAQKNRHLTPPDDGLWRRPKPPGSQPG